MYEMKTYLWYCRIGKVTRRSQDRLRRIQRPMGIEPRAPELGPDDLLEAAEICRRTLTPVLDDDWSVPAGDLEWDCRRTLDHIADVMAIYSGYLASHARGRLPIMRNGDPSLSLADLPTVVGALTEVFTTVARATPSRTHAYHPAEMVDVSGYIAMECEEILLHTADIMQGLGRDFRPPDSLSARILRRLFPWAPTGGDTWLNLRWTSGRSALPDRERLGPDWYWHCAPLDEWDGTIKKRTAPPAWR
jgi:hypothetical protein